MTQQHMIHRKQTGNYSLFVHPDKDQAEVFKYNKQKVFSGTLAKAVQYFDVSVYTHGIRCSGL